MARDLLLTGAAWEGVVGLSVVAVTMITAVLLFLVARRRYFELLRSRNRENRRALTRELMAVISGTGEPGEALRRSTPRQKLNAVTNIRQLVRGEDRNRLMQFVTDHDLLDGTIRAVRRGPVNRRIDAVRLLEWVGDAEAVAVLKDVLARDSNPRIRLEAAGALAQLGALPHPKVLIAALDLDLEAARPNRLHRALLRASAPSYGAELREILGRRIPDALRALLVEALGWTDDYSALPSLAEAAAHSNPEVRGAALRAARKINHPSAASWVVGLLDDPDENVRAQAARSCGQMGLRSASADLDRLGRDRSPWVRFRAHQALASMAKEAA